MLIVGITSTIIITKFASAPAAICFAVYAAFFATYALIYRRAMLCYLSTASAVAATLYTLAYFNINTWLPICTGLALAYYLVGYILRPRDTGWSNMFLFSGLGLGTILALLAPFQSDRIEQAIPIAIVATLFAVEAFMRRNVWLAFPANILYLISYFTILNTLNVNQPQYFSIGAALLGMLMQYLLTRAGSKTGAFIMGLLSQFVLLGTTYIQMVELLNLGFFFVLFIQSLTILAYGIVMRSRSLVIAPTGFVVLGVMTVMYNALKNLSLVVIIGVTGIVLLLLGIIAVVMRERITTLAERFSDWNA
jgi:hypothetical protein